MYSRFVSTFGNPLMRINLKDQFPLTFRNLYGEAATSVHALPCACGQLALSCPTWLWLASSTMASLPARNLFLLEHSALKFDLSGVVRRSKQDIFKSRYELGEFHHLYNELRKDPTKCFEYCNMLPSTLDYIVQAIQHTFHTAQQIFRKQYLQKKDCDSEVSPTYNTFNTLYSVSW